MCKLYILMYGYVCRELRDFCERKKAKGAGADGCRKLAVNVYGVQILIIHGCNSHYHGRFVMDG